MCHHTSLDRALSPSLHFSFIPGMNQPAANPSAQTHPWDKSPLKGFWHSPCSCIPTTYPRPHPTTCTVSLHCISGSLLHKRIQHASTAAWSHLSFPTPGFTGMFWTALKGIPGGAEPAPATGMRMNFNYQCEGRLSRHQS